MQKRPVEQLTLVASVVKWTYYASIVGVLVGFGTAAFLRSFTWTSGQLAHYADFYLLLPLTLLASGTLVSWLAPDAAGHGTALAETDCGLIDPLDISLFCFINKGVARLGRDTKESSNDV